MADVLSQEVQSGALALLVSLGVDTSRFKPGIIGQLSSMATGLLAGVSPTSIEYDAFNNPFIVTGNDERVSLAAVIVHEGSIFVYNREGKDSQNWNPLPDIIGAVGFGLSSLPFKIPAEMAMMKVASTHFSDYMAIEITNGEGDKAIIKMPIVVVRVSEISGFEEHFVTLPEISENMTAKLKAAITAIKEQK